MTSLFLEVRPSNAGAQSLYGRLGFTQVAVRRDYYPARGGREDALIFKIQL
jgi:[ribosomal protein S18]-alanine N-acetyltransferase